MSLGTRLPIHLGTTADSWFNGSMVAIVDACLLFSWGGAYLNHHSSSVGMCPASVVKHAIHHDLLLIVCGPPDNTACVSLSPGPPPSSTAFKMGMWLCSSYPLTGLQVRCISLGNATIFSVQLSCHVST